MLLSKSFFFPDRKELCTIHKFQTFHVAVGCVKRVFSVHLFGNAPICASTIWSAVVAESPLCSSTVHAVHSVQTWWIYYCQIANTDVRGGVINSLRM
jgi:hypothetical protein